MQIASRTKIALAILLATLCTPAVAWCATTETVVVNQVMEGEDKGIITRKNGDRYQIEKGAGCSSFARTDGKTVKIRFSGNDFCTIKCTLILEAEGETCRVWDSKPVKSAK